MAAAALIVEAAKMIIGGVVGGITTAVAVSQQIKEYNTAAAEVRAAMQSTSGKALLNAQIKEGKKFASEAARSNLGMAASKVNPEGTKKVQNTFEAQDYLGDFNQQATRTNAIKQAEYDAATARAQNLIQQADKQYMSTIATGQAVNKGLGALGETAQDLIGGLSKKSS